MMKLPPQVNKAFALLDAAGYEAFLVGGAVRDYVRSGSPAKDWDITTNALPEQVEEVFAGYRLIETGLKHGMGKNAKSCKGFFLVSSRCKLIMINSDLPESIQRIILVHELGHADLHSDSAISAFHEFTFLDDTDRMEYEANIFAAEFLLNDEDVFEALQQQMDFFQIASCLCVPPELLDFKLRILQREGVEIKAPYIAHGDFLKRDLGQPLN